MQNNQSQPWLVRGARILDPAQGVDRVGDLFFSNGAFAAPPAGGLGCGRVVEIDGAGKIAMPSPIDLHVHFREGAHGGGDAGAAALAESIASGSCAAARGGFATVVAMPNTEPPTDTPARARFQAAAPRHPFRALRVLPSACCTKGRLGAECAELEALAAAGAAAFTDDGAMVADDSVMEEAMRRAAALGVVVMDHAVVPPIAGAGVIRDCAAARALGLPLFPSEAETSAVARDIALCRKTGCRVHIQHLSCGASVELIRAAQAEGLPVTAEATPHHLYFAAEDIPVAPGGDGVGASARPLADYKMNPPLGTRADVAALRQGVADGVISCFATDHAPHSAAAKAKGFLNAPFGVIGLETALAATYSALVASGERGGAGECGAARSALLSPLEWAARWICGPASVIGINAPSFAIGSHSAATILSLESWEVRETDFASRSRNTPFIGATLAAKVWRMLN